jgi:heme/copper-type cytochrome/quinol oxidase subunit 2
MLFSISFESVVNSFKQLFAALFVLAAFFITVLLPIYVCIVTYKWARKKRIIAYWLIVPILTLAFFTYQIYTSIYPTNGFYKSEFEHNTGIEFPNSGEIIRKDADYPDTHGDYRAIALFKVNKTDFYSLLHSIQNDRRFIADTFISNNNFSLRYTHSRKDRDLTFSLSFNEVDFLIEMERNSW